MGVAVFLFGHKRHRYREQARMTLAGEEIGGLPQTRAYDDSGLARFP